jgi:hypothetical protein
MRSVFQLKFGVNKGFVIFVQRRLQRTLRERVFACAVGDGRRQLPRQDPTACFEQKYFTFSKGSQLAARQ